MSPAFAGSGVPVNPRQRRGAPACELETSPGAERFGPLAPEIGFA